MLAAGIFFFKAEAKRRGFDWGVFRSTLASLDAKWLILAGFFAILTYYGRALRWAVLIRPISPKPGMWKLFSATAIGFSAITLFGRPGEFVRPYLIAKKTNTSVSSQLAAWLLERIYDLLIALLVFGFALAHVDSSKMVLGPALTWVLAVGGWFVGIMCLVCLVVLILIRQMAEKMRRRLLAALAFLPPARLQKAEKLVNAFVQGVESTKDHGAVGLLIFYTILEWVLIGLCFLSIMKAFGSVLHFSLVDILIFMGFVSFGAVVQIPGVGGGIQVVSILVLTELFQVPLEVASSIALLIWLITFVVIVPLGVVLAFREGVHWGELRHLEDEVEGATPPAA